MEIIHFVANLSNQRGMENQAILQYIYQKKIYKNVKIWTLTLSNSQKKIYKRIVYRFLKPKIIFSSIYIFFNTFFLNKKTIVHVHGLSEYLLPFLLVRKFNNNIRLVLKISNSGKKSSFKKIRNKFPFFGEFLIVLAVSYVDKWIYINKTIKSEILEEGVPIENLHNIPNGVELMDRKNYSFNKLNKSIAWVGSLVDHKNVKLAIDILNYLPSSYRLYIYGNGPLYDEIKNYISLKGLTKSITLVGWVEKKDLYKMLKNHSIYLSTSIAEGLSNSLLESISIGLIPVCFDINANKEVLGNKYKLIIKDNDPKTWANSIKKINKEYFHLAEYLKKRIKIFDIKKIIIKIQKVYES